MTKGLKADLETLVLALDGIVSPVLRMLLSSILNHIDDMSRRVEALDDFVTEQMREVSAAIEALCQIPGISTTGAQIIIAEIGTDMSAFEDSQHICSWAGLSPGNDKSAGKRKSTHINKGNPYLKSMLCEIAWVISSHREMYLSGWYWRVKQRRGAKRATIALARKLLTMIYSMLKAALHIMRSFLNNGAHNLNGNGLRV